VNNKRRWLAALAVIALISTGCWKAPARTGSGGDKIAALRDQGVKFAECIRHNGAGDFPDPNAAGEFVYGVSVSPAVWQKAVEACKDLQPPGALSTKRSPEQQQVGLKFARCIRDNGVQDFPDPVQGEPLVDTNRIPSSSRPGGMTILDAAMQKCRSFVEQGAGGQ
jgi:hypothetical protein